MKLIIDTDPGVDDAMALFWAHAAPELELIGLTTVFGNVRVDQATRNALVLCDVMGLDIPVAEGAGQPSVLPPFTPSAYVHGDEGFGDMPAMTPTRAKDPRDAVTYLTETVRAYRGEVVVAPIGPLTNIAAAIEADPDFAKNVKQIVIMGGGLKGGNITPHAEANFYHDPHAAHVVMTCGAPIIMVGLDITEEVTCVPADFAAMAKASPKHGKMLQDMSHFYLRFYAEYGLDGCGLHDPAAIIAITHPELFEMKRTGVSVVSEGEEAGRSVATDGPGVDVAIGGDADAIKALFMERIGSLP